jgi:hypothetical protein
MREGGSGIYYPKDEELGYALCMISGGKTWQTSTRRDPYLLAIWRELGEPKEVANPWFRYEWTPHRLRLTRSGVGLQSISQGLKLERPQEADEAAFKMVCSEFGANDECVLTLAKSAGADPKSPACLPRRTRRLRYQQRENAGSI